MIEVLKMGKALYEVNTRTMTYRYYGRNIGRVSKAEEDRNKNRLNGDTRILRGGRKKIFRYT